MKNSDSIKGFEKVSSFESVNKKKGIIFRFDPSRHYHPFLVLNAEGRILGEYQTLEVGKAAAELAAAN